MSVHPDFECKYCSRHTVAGLDVCSAHVGYTTATPLDPKNAEIARLWAMMPSESTIRLVRQWYDQAVIALASIGHLLDDREAAEKQLATAGEWLARLESAKENGR